MNIQFSPPDISGLEISEVTKALESGWITTGPKTKLFEQKIAEYCGTNKAVCLNSATACLEMALRMLDVGPGDEVIVPAYTYTASASVVDHVGAKIVFVDTGKDSFTLDYEALYDAITERTKVIIPVDIGGVLCDYDRIYSIVESKKNIFKASSELQSVFGRVVILADAAHSFGAYYQGKRSGSNADFTSFSFHAVKNLTTAEGGALTWREHPGLDSEALYKKLMLWTLHGQSKDALNKMKLGSWEYDIVYPAFKCNMTDITAALGLAQLARFDGLIEKRKKIYNIYNHILAGLNYSFLHHDETGYEGNCHLYLVRIAGINETQRNKIITKMAEAGIACNVHFKPLPMMTAYKKLGFDIVDYPNAYAQYQNEITLPMHTLLSIEDAEYVANTFKDIVLGVTSPANEDKEVIIERVWSGDSKNIDYIKKIHADCGEKMFLDNGLLHWADPLPVDYWERIALEKELYIVRTQNGETIGFFDLSINPNKYFDVNKSALFIGKLAITPNKQKQGYGKKCLCWINSYAKGRGCQYIHATAYTQSKEATNFLIKNKFVKLYIRATKHFIVDCYELKL